MAKGKKCGAEEIVTKLRLAEVELSKGHSVEEVCKKLQISPQSFYRWRKEYGGLEIDQAKLLKELERENARLKRLVANQVKISEVAHPIFCSSNSSPLYSSLVNSRALFLSFTRARSPKRFKTSSMWSTTSARAT